jgi:hypothetical protein
MENKIHFLSIAISDAQELIRFIDNKTAIIITILGAFIVSFFASLDKIVDCSEGYINWFWLFLGAFFFLIILCIIVTTRIIKPTNNPIENINFEKTNKPTLRFFLTPNDYSGGHFKSFANSDKFKLKEDFTSYSQIINTVNESEIIDSLTLELFKISFIRNIKNDRFNTLLWLLFFTTISFFISFLLFRIETHNIMEIISQFHKNCCGN